MMDIQREFENFEACMEGHETAYSFFEAGWQAALEYARGQEPVAEVVSEETAGLYDVLPIGTKLYTAPPAQPVQPAEVQQEPVAYYTNKGNWPRVALAMDGNYEGYETPLYTHPAQPVQPAVNEQLLLALKVAKRYLNIYSQQYQLAEDAIAAAEAAKEGV